MMVLNDFQERAIRLTEERRKHIREYADPGIEVRAIRETLSRPDVMTEAFHHPELRLYYRIYTRRMDQDRSFHVIVKVRGYDMFVVTAFYGKGLSWGGESWKD